MAALTEALARRGYHDAEVHTNRVERNNESGAVVVELKVEEGLPTIVRSVEVTVEGPQDDGLTNEWTLHPDKPYSQLWQQNLARQLQEEQFARGHPDAAVTFSTLRRATNASSIQMDMSAHVTTGPHVRVGEVMYSGNDKTRSSVLESRMTLEAGDVLNRLEAERSRRRLARLGVFESVGLRYEEVNDTTRDVIYEFRETKPMSLSVLAGYGSYELLRGGLEFEHRNVLGLAHNVRLRGIQSFKSTSGDLQYTIPEVFGENVNVFARGSGLVREEVTFTREEFGGSVGVQKRIEAIKTDMSVHYDYEFLNASDLDIASTNATGLQDARAAAIVLDLNRDRRETPLLPRTGSKLFSKFEFASAGLGGNVDYQRIIVGGSFHLDVNGGRLLHLGLIHGNSFTFGATDEDLPFNKRFFPGGQNSVRGYQDGEASPLDADGNQLGAETYTQVNFEFEQLLTKSWSIVAFFDAVGFAQDRGDYPWDEELYSVGGGIRWRSIIGPVRLEYGHNLNPRELDPAGTLHFSIGFPF
jgi:outer membrane protein assembly complex protein YaeT